ncbi:MAG TPA: hypothetical protein VJ760_10370 [Nitrospiraceae bacterium]|nr:hypothetical protein [Nitrospiraceae bacterium]
MKRLIPLIIGGLTFALLLLPRLSSGVAEAGSRLGNDDMVFSYSGETDRLVFGGLGYVHTIHQDRYHPAKSILHVQDLKTGAKIKVFEAASGYIGTPKISPSGTTIAVQISEDERFTNRRLLVLTADGKEITSFVQVRHYAWSPDSRFLAYTTGDIEAIYTIYPTGTWLYDQHLKTTRKIFDTGDYVAWSQSDNSLYIWDESYWEESGGDRHILRYDPRTQKVVETNYHGIYFSPSGRYYHSALPPNGVGTFEVFDTQTNQPFLSHRPRIAALLPSARVVGWAPEGEVLILEVNRQDLRSENFPQGRFDTVLYDVAHDIARVIPDDSVIGWQNGQAILHARGKFTKRPLATLPLLPETPETPAKPVNPPGKPSSRPQP